ncbi:hypothetical protein [Vibrio splendidus]|uniref:hypothetical protein n=1 Tax=Vibrio splendidus TaxID=29497 RepID=UPI003D0E9F8B
MKAKIKYWLLCLAAALLCLVVLFAVVDNPQYKSEMYLLLAAGCLCIAITVVLQRKKSTQKLHD